MFEAAGGHLDLGPFEGCGRLVVGGDKGVDERAQFVDAPEACSPQRLTGEDAEPDLDLIEPGRVGGGEVEVDIGVLSQPKVLLGFVGVEVVQDHMDCLASLGLDNFVHEVEELPSAAALIVSGLDFAGDDIERGEEGAGSVANVFVGSTGQRPAVGQAQPPLFAFQGLNTGFLIDRQHHGVLRRGQLQPHDVRGFGGKFRVGGDAPTATARQADTQSVSGRSKPAREGQIKTSQC